MGKLPIIIPIYKLKLSLNCKAITFLFRFIDTNVWIDDFEDIRTILMNSGTNSHYKIVLPYVVIGEIDKLKSDPNKDQGVQEAAKRANYFIRHLQLIKHESFMCQVIWGLF